MPSFRGIVTATVLIGSMGWSQASAETQTVRVQLRNDARVADSMLTDARQIAVAIYVQAGLSLVWSDEEPAMTIALRPRASRATAARAKDAMGYTPGGGIERGRLALVLIERVNAVADGYNAPRTVVLGAAIAHELGHLLISKEHSKDGVMKASFNQSDFRKARTGKLLITEEQIRLLRASGY